MPALAGLWEEGLEVSKGSLLAVVAAVRWSDGILHLLEGCSYLPALSGWSL